MRRSPPLLTCPSVARPLLQKIFIVPNWTRPSLSTHSCTALDRRMHFGVEVTDGGRSRLIAHRALAISLPTGVRQPVPPVLRLPRRQMKTGEGCRDSRQGNERRTEGTTRPADSTIISHPAKWRSAVVQRLLLGSCQLLTPSTHPQTL